METFYCGIYDPVKSKPYHPIVYFKLSMRPRLGKASDAIEIVFERVKCMAKFKRLSKWSLERTELWKVSSCSYTVKFLAQLWIIS